MARARTPTTTVAVALFYSALLSLFCGAVASAASASTISRPQGLTKRQDLVGLAVSGTVGLVDVYCENEAPESVTDTPRSGPSLSCPADHVISVQSAFWGRDIPGVPGVHDTCPCFHENGTMTFFCQGLNWLGYTTTDNNTDCLGTSAVNAAIASYLALKCDGRRECNVDWTGKDMELDLTRPSELFPKPCYSWPPPAGNLSDPNPFTYRMLRTTYDCYHVSAVKVPTPAVPSIRYGLPYELLWLSLTNPSTFLEAKLSDLSATIREINKLAIQYAVKAGAKYSLELYFIDLNLKDLASFIDAASGGQLSLGDLASLSIHAVNLAIYSNLVLDMGTTAKPAKASLTLEAANLAVGSGHRIRIHAQTSPTVTIKTLRSFPNAQVDVQWVQLVGGAKKTTGKGKHTTARKPKMTTKKKVVTTKRKLVTTKKKRLAARHIEEKAVSSHPLLSGRAVILKPVTSTPNAISNALAKLIERSVTEMIRNGRYVEALAVVTDITPALTLGASNKDIGASAALTRIVSAGTSLIFGQRNRVLKQVPYLSRRTITQSIINELDYLSALTAKTDSLLARGATAETAKDTASSSLAVLKAQLESYRQELGIQTGFLKSINETVVRLNATYFERLTKMDEAATKVSQAVEKKAAKEFAWGVTNLVFDIGATLFGGPQVVFGVVDFYKRLKYLRTQSAFGMLFILHDTEKLGKHLENISKLFKTFKDVSGIVKQFMSLAKASNYAPFAINTDLAKSFAQGMNSSALADVSVAALSFQDLHDTALLVFQPSVQQGITAATEYSLAMAQVANAGYDMTMAMINQISQVNQVVLSTIRYQAALSQMQELQKSVDAFASQASAVSSAVLKLQETALETKLRAMDRLDQACKAYEFATTQDCPAGDSVKLGSSPEEFAAQTKAVLDALSTSASASQCICNMTFVVTDPVFIGNLSTGATAILDLAKEDVNGRLLLFDNIHINMMNIKPAGIKVSGNASSPTWLRYIVAGSSEFANTAWSESQGRIVNYYSAPAVPIQMIYEPTAGSGLRPVVPGSLTDEDTATFFVPTPYTRFAIRDASKGVKWDYSSVQSVLVELWGFGRLPEGSDSAAAKMAADSKSGSAKLVPNAASGGGSICSVCFA